MDWRTVIPQSHGVSLLLGATVLEPDLDHSHVQPGLSHQLLAHLLGRLLLSAVRLVKEGGREGERGGGREGERGGGRRGDQERGGRKVKREGGEDRGREGGSGERRKEGKERGRRGQREGGGIRREEEAR